jgi:predicted Zn-dependent peptidase
MPCHVSLNQHRLSNGFRIVTEHMPGLASASIGVWVTAGARHETPDQNGIAHFLEHMAFKGTAKRTSLQIAEAIEDVGGYINAYTSREVTAYYVRVLENDVALGLDVIADILRDPILDQGEIETERGVILQEIGQALDTPDDVIFDWLQERAYPDQPMGRTILGPSERVSSFQRHDLSGFIAQHYGPDQMILAAAGAVDHDEIVRLAETLFGDMPPKQLVEPSPATFHGGEVRQVKSLEQAHFALGFESPGYRADDIYVAQIYASALGGGMSSRLFQEIREARGLCYTIFAQAGAYADTGMMTIYAGTSGEQLPELANITIDEMKRAATDMSPAEVARARAQMKAGMLMGLESPSNRAERLARLIQIWDRIPPLEETIAKIDAVTTGDVRDLAGHMAASAPAALALYGPVESGPDLETLQRRRAA